MATPGMTEAVVETVITRPREKARHTYQFMKPALQRLHNVLKVPVAVLSIAYAGMQNQLYAWSHDFAVKRYVGVPVSNQFIGFTGEEWEYLNIFLAQGSAVGLTLLGTYYLADVIWTKNALNRMHTNKLEGLIKDEDVGEITRQDIEDYLEALRIYNPEFDQNSRDKWPRLHKANDLLKSRVALPVSLAAHTLVLSLIHYTWMKRYHEGEMYVGGVLHESAFWNWTWFVGGYTTFGAMLVSAYYFFYNRALTRPGRKIKKLEKKIQKYEKKRDAIPFEVDMPADDLKRRNTLDEIVISLNTELKRWEMLDLF